jgi:hypothetical protein
MWQFASILTAIVFVAALVLLSMFALSSCGKDDDPTNEEDNRKGEPYKFRVEVSCVNTDRNKIACSLGSINYVDNNGLPRTEWLSDPDHAPDDIAVESPYIKEFECTRAFNKLFMDIATFSKAYYYDDPEQNRKEPVTGKLYINNKLIITSNSIWTWQIAMQYDSKTKKYRLKASGSEEMILDSLD